jgi:GAF domain-containing protein/HAMP domain-containing protein
MMINNFNQLLKRAGGWQLLIIVALTQLVAVLGAVPGIVFLQLNIVLNEEMASIFSRLLPLQLLVSFFILLGISWSITKTARKRITEWSHGELHSNPEEELTAWKEITNFTSQYGISAATVLLLVNVLPAFFILQSQRDVISSVFQPGSISSPVPVIVLLGGLASVLGYVIMALLVIEYLMLPSRLALLPYDFDTQLKGRSGALLGTKFQILTIGLIVIAVAIIAPIGYQQAIKVIYSEVSSINVFRDLQNYSIALSILTLMLGVGFSYYAGRSVSDPIKGLIEVLQEVEQGNLSQRVPVTSTDELATVATHFNRMLSRLDELQSSLEHQVAERTKQISASNELGRVASSILDPDELLSKVINLFTDRFNYYYAAIYLLDPSEKWAELKEATGDAGKILKQNHHRLELTSKSMVAACIRDRGPRIAHNTAEEKNRFENPLLPYTRSEIALPLIIGDRVIGALDVQSTKTADFGLAVIETMQNMAGQVTIALENARLFQEAQQRIREMRVIQQQYLQEGWGSGLSIQRDDLEYGIGEDSLSDTQKLEVSVNLRDQIIGQIFLERDDEWTPEQQSLIDAVAAQAAVALENARLVSESRQIALRERMLTEINSRIWSSTTIDGVLQTVVKELGRRLDASRATIKLNMDDDQ